MLSIQTVAEMSPEVSHRLSKQKTLVLTCSIEVARSIFTEDVPNGLPS